MIGKASSIIAVTLGCVDELVAVPWELWWVTRESSV
jgi:hypothetical protein